MIRFVNEKLKLIMAFLMFVVYCAVALAFGVFVFLLDLLNRFNMVRKSKKERIRNEYFRS